MNNEITRILVSILSGVLILTGFYLKPHNHDKAGRWLILLGAIGVIISISLWTLAGQTF